jgi:hypothetical protein
MTAPVESTGTATVRIHGYRTFLRRAGAWYRIGDGRWRRREAEYVVDRSLWPLLDALVRPEAVTVVVDGACPRCGGVEFCWCQNPCETCGEPTYNGTFTCESCRAAEVTP